MKYLNEFLAVCGDITVGKLVVYLLAFYFLYSIYKELKKLNDAKLKERQEKLAAEQAKNKKIDEAWEITQKYPEYRQESISIRDGIERKIQELRNGVNTEIQELRSDFAIILKRLDDMEAKNKKRECSKLRDMLLQNYRYYTSTIQNPSQSWTRMESEAFWELFREYEEAGGDGYMHSEVQPAMERLLIVEVGHK
jgi:hypothetical protein